MGIDMATRIRDIEAGDLEPICRINQANKPCLSGVDMEKLTWLWERADFRKLLEEAGEIIGFILCLGPGHSYSSPNYQWFVNNYESFLYVDRIAISDGSRGRGLGSALYGELEAFGVCASSEILCCEVNTKPMNELSLRFHKKQGFEKVGEQDTEGGKKKVALLAKKI